MEITVQQVELLSDDDYIYLDVRGEIAYQHGHIPKAYEWAGDFSHIEELPKDKRLIVYCNYGEKSAPIAEQLRQEGYEALNLSGGYREWLLHVTSQKEQMQDVSKDGLHLFSSTEELTPDEVKRYDRQIILPQVGSDGQKKLKKIKSSDHRSWRLRWHQRLYILQEQALERSELWMQMMSACQTYRDRSFTQAKEKEQIRQNQQRNQCLN